MSEPSNTEVSMVTIPLEEYIELRQTKQNNMYLLDRFMGIEDRFRCMEDDIRALHTRCYDLEKRMKEKLS